MRATLTLTLGTNNTIIGSSADVGSSGLTNAAAIGANAQVTQSNSLVLGSINGVHGATANTFVGIGTTAPLVRLNVVQNADFRVARFESLFNDWQASAGVGQHFYWRTHLGVDFLLHR